MKKFQKAAALISALVLLVCMTGCMKIEFRTDISADGKMNFGMTYLISDELKEYGGEDMIPDTAEWEESGFTAEQISEDGYTGIRVYRSFDVKAVSGKDEVIVDLNSFGPEAGTATQIFTEKSSGLFSTEYSAHFFVSMDLGMEEDDAPVQEGSFQTQPQAVKLSDFDDDDVILFDSEDDGMDPGFDFDLGGGLGLGDDFDLGDVMEMTYVLTLPEKAISHNADTVSEDGLTYTWNLDYGEDEDILFTFSLKKTNLLPLLLGGGAVILLVIIGITAAALKSGKKKGQEDPMEYMASSAPAETENVPAETSSEAVSAEAVSEENAEAPSETEE